MEKPQISFQDVSNVLAASFGIAPSKRQTFVSKVHHLKKFGLPQGVNTGRGKAAKYELWHIAEIALYLDIMDAGLVPSMIAEQFSETPFYSIGGMGRFVEDRSDPRPYFGVFRLNALDYLRKANGDSDRPTVFDSQLGLGRDLSSLISGDNQRPLIMINMTSRMDSLKEAISECVPALAGIPFFDEDGFPIGTRD